MYACLYTDPMIKAKIFADQLATFHQCLQMRTSPIVVPSMESTILYHILILFKFIYSEGVADLLSNINPGKSHGTDNLLACFLKRPNLRLLLPLHQFFRHCYQGTLSEVWRQAIVVLVFIKGRHTYSCKYRPISLICICTKILEQTVYSSIHLSTHLQRYVALCDTQHGFCPNRGYSANYYYK